MKFNSVVFLYIVGICIHEISAALKLPSYIRRCAINDPELSECEKRNGNEVIPRLVKGDPTYGIPVLDPLVLKDLQLGDESTSISVGEMIIYGYSNAKIITREHDVVQRRIHTEILVPELNMYSDYDMNGNFLDFPISGSGLNNMTFVNFRLNHVTDYDLIPKSDGRTYIQTKNYNVDVMIDGGRMHLTNLFRGNKELGVKVNQFLNDNFLESVGYVMPAMRRVMFQLYQDFEAKLLNLVPFEEYYTYAAFK